MTFQIDPEFRDLLPELDDDESSGLEERILAEGIRDPLVVWQGENILVDGHHRYQIARAHDLEFDVEYMHFNDRDAVKIWMIDNQQSRRNLTPAMRLELGEIKAEVLRPRAEAARIEGNRRGAEVTNNRSSQKSDTTAPVEHIDTLKEAADYAGVSRDTASKWRYVREKAPEEVKESTLKGETSINKAYTITKQAEKKREYEERLELISANTVEDPSGVYDVIVMDPPWPMQKIARDVRPNQVSLDYPVMQESDLRDLTIPAADDCHMWLWTTHKFLPMALRLIEHWGFKYTCTFVWHKPGGPQPYGLPQYNNEFALYARKGNPRFVDTKAFFTAFDAPRGKHSEKPDEFYDVVRRVTGGRRIDMFNRREIEGFDRWGNEV